MLPLDYLASITLANSRYDAPLDPNVRRPELVVAAALMGPVPISQEEEDRLMVWLEKGEINPNLRLNARIMHMDEAAKPPMGTLWCSYEGCKLSHLLLAFAKRSPRFMKAFIQLYVDPSDVEFSPFWFRNDGQTMPGRYASRPDNQHASFRDVQEIASDICWPLLIADPRTPLHRVSSLSRTVADDHVMPLLQHIVIYSEETVSQDPHYARFMCLLKANAPLHFYDDNQVLVHWMRTASEADWRRFRNLKPDEPCDWITPSIVRQWSLGRRLGAVLSSPYWQGKEAQALGLVLALPESEQMPATPQLIQLCNRLNAATNPSPSWSHLIAQPSASSGIAR